VVKLSESIMKVNNWNIYFKIHGTTKKYTIKPPLELRVRQCNQLECQQGEEKFSAENLELTSRRKTNNAITY